MLRIYGEQVVPLSKHVKEFCLKQGNMKETNLFQQLVYARWAWKELFRRSIWEVKNQVVDVDCKNHTLRLPSDCERLINISVIDKRGKLQPLTCDPGLSTIRINCIQPKCSCDKCHGEDTLCGAIDAAVTYTTETVIIQGSPYTMETWTRYSNGAIQKEIKTPSYNTATDSIVYNEEITTLCNVEVTDKGCIKRTASNMELLRDYCGCGNFDADQTGVYYGAWYNPSLRDLIPQSFNNYGYWNVNAADRNIIHIFRHDDANKHPHEVFGIDKAVISYQTNGEEEGQEIMIPEYAQFAIDMGIMWQQKLYNPRAGTGDKQYAQEQWRAACRKVNQHLNPIRMDDIMKLQTHMRRW